MNPKSLFLSAFFLFASSLCLRAQGTYEYATVTYSYGVLGIGIYYLGVSMGDSYVETKVKSEFKSVGIFSDLTVLLEKVNELAKDEWEVYNTSTMFTTDENRSGGYMTYHLRRKKP